MDLCVCSRVNCTQFPLWTWMLGNVRKERSNILPVDSFSGPWFLSTREAKGQNSTNFHQRDGSTNKNRFSILKNICEASGFSLETWRLLLLPLQPGKDWRNSKPMGKLRLESNRPWWDLEEERYLQGATEPETLFNLGQTSGHHGSW